MVEHFSTGNQLSYISDVLDILMARGLKRARYIIIVMP
jgi:hypothetical protein